MIETEAQVIRLEEEKAWVRIKPHKPCGQCDPEKGCKSVALSRMFGTQQDFCVGNGLGAKPGELVKVAIGEGILLKTALWAYGLPVFLLIAGAALGQWLAPVVWASAVSIVCGVIGLLSGLLLLRRQRQLAIRAQPAIVAKISALPSCPSTHH